MLWSNAWLRELFWHRGMFPAVQNARALSWHVPVARNLSMPSELNRARANAVEPLLPAATIFASGWSTRLVAILSVSGRLLPLTPNVCVTKPPAPNEVSELPSPLKRPTTQKAEFCGGAPKALPVMKLNPAVQDLFAFRYEDFTLEGYAPHPHIKAEVSV